MRPEWIRREVCKYLIAGIFEAPLHHFKFLLYSSVFVQKNSSHRMKSDETVGIKYFGAKERITDSLDFKLMS